MTMTEALIGLVLTVGGLYAALRLVQAGNRPRRGPAARFVKPPQKRMTFSRPTSERLSREERW